MRARNLFRSLSLALGAAAIALCASGAQAAITDNLVVHLTLDDTFADSSGQGNNGAGVNGPVFAAGKIGNAITVDSNGVARPGNVSKYVTLGTPADLNFGSGTDFSVSLWAKFSSWVGDPSLISNKNWDSGGNTGWVLSTGSDGRFQWNYREVTPQTRKDYDGPAGTISDGEWHHIAVSFDRGGNGLAYLDGVLVNTTSLGAGGTTIDSGLPTNIGQDGTGDYTDGGGGIKWSNALIDDVGVWRRVVTGDEVAAIYTAGLAGNNLQSVPEPTAFVLGGLALAGLLGLVRRTKR
jgi:Concanavalin A-like lectin/glucanases superfamily